MSAIDPASVIGDVAELYEPVAEEAGLALTSQVQEGLSLVANRELVSQAVANLVDNAIKYSQGVGSARSGERPEIAISLGRAGNAIEITVADRGPGIAPQDRQRALQRFVRLEKSRSRPGSGLGLSLVAAVARLHGGAVRLEDNDPGLKVVLSLPEHEPARALPAAAWAS
jgi:signal transduction histidine kinase